MNERVPAAALINQPSKLLLHVPRATSRRSSPAPAGVADAIISISTCRFIGARQ